MSDPKSPLPNAIGSLVKSIQKAAERTAVPAAQLGTVVQAAPTLTVQLDTGQTVPQCAGPDGLSVGQRVLAHYIEGGHQLAVAPVGGGAYPYSILTVTRHYYDLSPLVNVRAETLGPAPDAGELASFGDLDGTFLYAGSTCGVRGGGIGPLMATAGSVDSTEGDHTRRFLGYIRPSQAGIYDVSLHAEMQYDGAGIDGPSANLEVYHPTFADIVDDGWRSDNYANFPGSADVGTVFPHGGAMVSGRFFLDQNSRVGGFVQWIGDDSNVWRLTLSVAWRAPSDFVPVAACT